jgi:acetylornithine deacetylase
MDKFVSEELLPSMKKVFPKSFIKKEVIGEVIGFEN